MRNRNQNLPSQFNLKLDDRIPIPDPEVQFKGRVIGIDRYHERTAAGGENTWVSYTLEGEGAPEGSRWKRFWAVDGQADKNTGFPYLRRSFYVASGNDLPDGYVLDRNLSGRVILTSEGDASLSSGAGVVTGESVANGALFTYRNGEGQVWAEEVFDGSPRLTFEAIFEPDSP